MRFVLDHRFDAALERVEQAVLDPAYQERLRDLPNVSERRVLEQADRPDGTVKRVVAYRFAGHLPAPVVAAIGSDQISWDEVAVFHPDAHEWRFEVQPHVFEGRFECRGWYRFESAGAATLRHMEVDLKVKVPFVGSRAERAIRDGLVETMDAEARILAEHLDAMEGTR